jgi:hypothetical protein
MSKRTSAVRALGLAVVLVLASALPANARPDVTAAGGPPTPGGAVFLVADMKGTNAPPADLDGVGRAVFRIQGTQVCWAISWSKIQTPNVGHIHLGEPGVNGPVVVGFWRGQLPDGMTGVTGCSTTTPETVAAILANPGGYYANVHNVEHPAGAVKDQLRIVNRGVDFNQLLRLPLVALMDGMQEVPGAGDPDGRAVGWVRVRGTTVTYSTTWSAIAQPSAGHIHIGATAQAGPIVVPFFNAMGGLPAGINGVVGDVAVNSTVARFIQRNPNSHYFNLHNAEFPAGAIRGQLVG